MGLLKVVAKLDTIGTSRFHWLHDDGKGFGAGEMTHLLPGLTLTKRRTRTHQNVIVLGCVCLVPNLYLSSAKKRSLICVLEIVKQRNQESPKILLRLQLQLPHTERTARRPDALTASCCTCLSRRFCIPCAVVLPRKPMYSDKASAT